MFDENREAESVKQQLLRGGILNQSSAETVIFSSLRRPRT